MKQIEDKPKKQIEDSQRSISRTAKEADQGQPKKQIEDSQRSRSRTAKEAEEDK